VQHAHQKGIIHRDIKPSNVLVALFDGKPVPKVIDFGVAKATGQSLTDKTLVTDFGNIVGTLEYMSPEQAELNQLDIDTRSDIYSLGVLLYELLTGSTPFSRKELKKAGVLEMLRVIREQEPSKPSTKLSTAESLPTLAVNRGTEPAKLTRLVRGELDWIVMKALEKDRNRRYETANGFAADVQRYLADEPVQACSPSTGYQLRKFAKRNKRSVIAVAMVFLALVVGIVGTSIGLIEAHYQRDAAKAAVEAEKKAKETAEARDAETNAVLGFVQNHVFAAARPEGKKGGLGYDVSLRKALKAALAAVDKSFPGQPLVEARVRRALGDTFLLLGDADLAAEQFQRALAVHSNQLGPDNPETLLTTNNLAASLRALGRFSDAMRLHEQNLAARTTKLGDNHADTVQTMENLATVYADLGRYPDGLRLREKVVAIRRTKLGPADPLTLKALNNLANSYSELHRDADALKIDEEVLALLQAKFGADHSETLDCRNNLALDYAAVGRFQDALKFQKETLKLHQAKLGKDHPASLVCMHNVAKAHIDLKQYEEAVKVLEETLTLQKIKPGPDHPDTLQSMYSLANSYGFLNRYEDALKFHREALELRKTKLGPDNRMTLYSMWGVGANLIKLNRGAEAIPIIDECLRRAAGDAAESSFSGLAEKRLRYFEAAKDAEGCRTTAELWEKLPCRDADSCYNAALFRAVAAGLFRTAPGAEAARTADDQAVRAIAWLQKAIAAGFADLDRLNKEKDLDPLRAREDFKKLLGELQAKRKEP
jgi:tetratricopeptide (TPR) repeat protein